MPVTRLHISDLHVRTGDSYDRDVVFRALVRCVRGFREKKGRTPDLIFTTGDIGYSGRADEYAIATKFFDELLEAAGLDRRRLYVVPGNHDVDRDAGSGLRMEFDAQSDVDKYFNPNNPKHHITEKQGAFLRWHRDYFARIRTMPESTTCGPVELVQIRGIKFGLLPINTALFCQALDYERLLVGRRCLDIAIEELNQLEPDLKIALMHHPVHYLSGFERQNIRASLVDHLDVILVGHLHEAGYAGVDLLTGRTLYCAAGATYQTREWPNRAYYATFDRGYVTIFPIRYEDQPREVWTLDPSLFPHETGYEATFPVPREPGFRSFWLPGDGLYRPPAPELDDVTKAGVAVGPRPKQGRSVRFMEAMGEDRPARKRKRSRKTKNNTKTRNRRKN
jgi:predicted phosphodiesterase